AITFTNKAAKEMKERVENILQEDVDSMWIGTFHAICSRILRVEIERIGFERNFTVYDRADQISLVKECLKDMGVDPKNVEIKNEINTISRLKNAGATEKNIDKEDFDINLSTFTMELFQKYEHKLKRYNSLDFDDLIVKTNLLFEENPDLREKYSERFKYVFVDEYQDTNDTQYKLIKNLVSKNDNICCVGDSDQSIYGWRGANIQNIQNFEKDFKNAKVILLEQNYRSTQPILDLANTVIKNNSLRKDKNLWTAKNEGDMPIYRRMYSDLDEADQVVQWIEQERYRQNPYEEMAILYRTNAQSRLFEEKLNRLGIPNRVVGGLKFYDRKEIKDCVSYLRIVENLNDNMALNRIINEPKRGIGKTTMDKLLQYSQARGISMMEYIRDTALPDFSNATAKKLQEFYYLIKSFPKDDLNVAELMEYILDKTGYRANLEKSTNRDDKTRLENIDEYISSLYQFVQDNPDKNLREYLETSSLMTDLDKTDDNTKGVSMMTIHAAKGLEFDVVFFTGLEEGTIPSRVDEDVEEERRLCYVAITRARKKLYITSVQSRRRFNEFQTKAESRFIEEMENKYKDESPNKEVSFRESFNTKVVDDYRTEASASITKKQNTVTKNNEKYRAGDKVSHKKFGTGVIVGIVEKDNGDELTINFDKKGLKKLNSSLAPLTRVE
ncbi:MAG: 3'-5' exonuclease, partial [Finegoldia magna]|nr:3'-5' exonuclease [Finegoldia magna]